MTIINTLANAVDTASNKLDHPMTGGVLILAGIFPAIFTSQFLSAVYFALLIPPAAWHCYLWVKKSLIPEIQRWFGGKT